MLGTSGESVVIPGNKLTLTNSAFNIITTDSAVSLNLNTKSGSGGSIVIQPQTNTAYALTLTATPSMTYAGSLFQSSASAQFVIGTSNVQGVTISPNNIPALTFTSAGGATFSKYVSLGLLIQPSLNLTLSGLSYPANCSSNSVFIILAPASKFTVDLQYLPTLPSISNSYVITLLYTTAAATVYCNSVTVSTGNTASGLTTIKYNGGTAAIPAIANNNLVIQTISCIYISANFYTACTTISVYSG